jgi:FkbM family methyltransferase
MSALQAVEAYYELFGVRGVMVAAKARWLHTWVEAAVIVPDLKHPVYIRLRTTDVSVFRQVLVTREYDSQFCKPLRTVIDAGANIGLTSVFYANKYPEATIVAVEPESSNFQMLKRNIAPYPNVIAVQAALWRDNQEIRLIDPKLGHYGFRTLEAPTLGSLREDYKLVRGVTLSRLMLDLHLNYVDLLKIDIEGSEKEVFEDSDSWVDNVGVIVVELHDEIREGCARSVYLGAKNFDREWRKGETVFLARREYVADEGPHRSVFVSAEETRLGRKPRVKIVQHA